MVDTDRVALSLALFELADRFVFEAAFVDQTSVDQARLCLDIAARLSDHARHVLSHADMIAAEAYLDAGIILIEQMQGERR